jgi:hypothetical protein
MIGLIMHKFDKNPGMIKYLSIIVCVGLMSCSSNTNKPTDSSSWDFSITHHDDLLDRNCQPIILQYQEILKGLINKDTAYVHVASNQLLQICDSLSTLKLGKDTVVQKIWADALTNIHSELQGLILSTEPKEINMSVHMTGVQILNGLAQIGYQAHAIYIFNAKDDDFEDGLVWFGIQKSARDPFHSDNRKLIVATQVLQEAHIQ